MSHTCPICGQGGFDIISVNHHANLCLDGQGYDVIVIDDDPPPQPKQSSYPRPKGSAPVVGDPSSGVGRGQPASAARNALPPPSQPAKGKQPSIIQHKAKPPSPALKPSEPFYIKLRGLSFGHTEEDVFQFFSGTPNLNLSLENIHVILSRDGRCHGDAFIMLDTQQDVTQALKRHKAMMGTRYIEVLRSSRIEMEATIDRVMNMPLPGPGPKRPEKQRLDELQLPPASASASSSSSAQIPYKQRQPRPYEPEQHQAPPPAPAASASSVPQIPYRVRKATTPPMGPSSSSSSSSSSSAAAAAAAAVPGLRQQSRYQHHRIPSTGSDDSDVILLPSDFLFPFESPKSPSYSERPSLSAAAPSSSSSSFVPPAPAPAPAPAPSYQQHNQQAAPPSYSAYDQGRLYPQERRYQQEREQRYQQEQEQRYQQEQEQRYQQEQEQQQQQQQQQQQWYQQQQYQQQQYEQPQYHYQAPPPPSQPPHLASQYKQFASGPEAQAQLQAQAQAQAQAQGYYPSYMAAPPQYPYHAPHMYGVPPAAMPPQMGHPASYPSRPSYPAAPQYPHGMPPPPPPAPAPPQYPYQEYPAAAAAPQYAYQQEQQPMYHPPQQQQQPQPQPAQYFSPYGPQIPQQQPQQQQQQQHLQAPQAPLVAPFVPSPQAPAPVQPQQQAKPAAPSIPSAPVSAPSPQAPVPAIPSAAPQQPAVKKPEPAQPQPQPAIVKEQPKPAVVKEQPKPAVIKEEPKQPAKPVVAPVPAPLAPAAKVEQKPAAVAPSAPVAPVAPAKKSVAPADEDEMFWDYGTQPKAAAASSSASSSSASSSSASSALPPAAAAAAKTQKEFKAKPVQPEIKKFVAKPQEPEVVKKKPQSMFDMLMDEEGEEEGSIQVKKQEEQPPVKPAAAETKPAEKPMSKKKQKELAREAADTAAAIAAVAAAAAKTASAGAPSPAPPQSAPAPVKAAATPTPAPAKATPAAPTPAKAPASAPSAPVPAPAPEPPKKQAGPPGLKDLIETADSLLDQKRYKEAFQSYSKCIEKDKNNSSLYCKRSLCLYHQNSFEKSLEDAEKAVSLDASNADAHYRIAMAELQSFNRIPKIMQAIVQAQRLDPSADYFEAFRSLVQRLTNPDILHGAIALHHTMSFFSYVLDETKHAALSVNEQEICLRTLASCLSHSKESNATKAQDMQSFIQFLLEYKRRLSASPSVSAKLQQYLDAIVAQVIRHCSAANDSLAASFLKSGIIEETLADAENQKAGYAFVFGKLAILQNVLEKGWTINVDRLLSVLFSRLQSVTTVIHIDAAKVAAKIFAILKKMATAAKGGADICQKMLQQKYGIIDHVSTALKTWKEQALKDELCIKLYGDTHKDKANISPMDKAAHEMLRDGFKLLALLLSSASPRVLESPCGVYVATVAIQDGLGVQKELIKLLLYKIEQDLLVTAEAILSVGGGAAALAGLKRELAKASAVDHEIVWMYCQLFERMAKPMFRYTDDTDESEYLDVSAQVLEEVFCLMVSSLQSEHFKTDYMMHLRVFSATRNMLRNQALMSVLSEAIDQARKRTSVKGASAGDQAFRRCYPAIPDYKAPTRRREAFEHPKEFTQFMIVLLSTLERFGKNNSGEMCTVIADTLAQMARCHRYGSRTRAVLDTIVNCGAIETLLTCIRRSDVPPASLEYKRRPEVRFIKMICEIVQRITLSIDATRSMMDKTGAIQFIRSIKAQIPAATQPKLSEKVKEALEKYDEASA